jgi:hypothetical protein
MRNYLGTTQDFDKKNIKKFEIQIVIYEKTNNIKETK